MSLGASFLSFFLFSVHIPFIYEKEDAAKSQTFGVKIEAFVF